MNTKVLKLLPLLLFALAALGANAVRAQAHEAEHSHVIDGVGIYIGVTPSELITSNYPTGSPESQMHGGVPKGVHYHHLMVALFDDTTGKRITNAKIVAKVTMPTDVNLPIQEKTLEAMNLANAPTYGQYFNMPVEGEYHIVLTIAVPNHPLITTTFLYVHE
ncbi:MAG: hypothetical protein KGL98_09140 [Gammaproteobacteria bacterium]|nr:hypothetical protein [Gammaproteobacteria bacterium]MBU6509006.1 hypothetical protein [Gammaproteobacteria bacterium]MDE1983795.1 hypothetical protein [Gammaproteobacteria bacterium]MDE2108310.1 hypothetical protein [Gammaproteobacteria bacterium]MDE2461399.1 hypothetical protein [Gammaproteobacteria bacterium]